MCGRTVCIRDGNAIRHSCEYRDRRGQKKTPAWKPSPGWQQYYPSYNVAPGAYTPVLYETRGDSGRVLQPMQWGLLPKWHRGSPKDFGYKMNNCRSETMMTTASFKTPLQSGQRCVILADGFYEWKKETMGKQPYYIYSPADEGHGLADGKNMDSVTVKTEAPEPTENYMQESDMGLTKLVNFAGLYDKWTSPEGSVIYSYSIITVDSAPSLKFIHHRMPAILTTSEDVDTWLDGDIPVAKAVNVIKPCDILVCHPVSPAVNNSRYSHPDCIVKVYPRNPTPKLSAGAAFMKNWLKKSDTQEQPSKVRDSNSTTAKSEGGGEEQKPKCGLKRALDCGVENLNKIIKRE